MSGQISLKEDEWLLVMRLVPLGIFWYQTKEARMQRSDTEPLKSTERETTSLL